jgi:uncharacterized membrane protein
MAVSAMIMGGFYAVAGVNHFLKPALYQRMMPSWIPAHKAMVLWSGVAELMLGLGVLWPVSRAWSAWGIIGLLIAVFPANFYMFRDPDRWPGIPRWALAVRLPVQGLLIFWAWTVAVG